jgi:hypothetical protein
MWCDSYSGQLPAIRHFADADFKRRNLNKHTSDRNIDVRDSDGISIGVYSAPALEPRYPDETMEQRREVPHSPDVWEDDDVSASAEEEVETAADEGKAGIYDIAGQGQTAAPSSPVSSLSSLDLPVSPTTEELRAGEQAWAKESGAEETDAGLDEEGSDEGSPGEPVLYPNPAPPSVYNTFPRSPASSPAPSTITPSSSSSRKRDFSSYSPSDSYASGSLNRPRKRGRYNNVTPPPPPKLNLPSGRMRKWNKDQTQREQGQKILFPESPWPVGTVFPWEPAPEEEVDFA